MMMIALAAVLLLADGAVAGSVTLPPRPPARLLQAPVVAAAPDMPALKLKVDDNSFLIGKLIERFREKRRLSEEDAARYANIFAFQDNEEFDKANAEIGKLSDYRLMGHVLSQRYLSKTYQASYAELSDWMSHYSDHPGADKVYALAARRQSAGATALARPTTGRGISGYQDFDVGQLAQPYLSSRRFSTAQRDVLRKVAHLAGDGSPTAAMNQLKAARKSGLLSAHEVAAAQAGVAQSFFYNGKVSKAYEYAAESSDKLKEQSPLAGWIAGLSAWRAGHYDEAAKFFERTATSKRASAWMTSAGAHWTARSLLRARKPEKVSFWLARAAEYPRTFYGIISLKALGLEHARFDWNVPDMGGKHIRALSADAAGRRALALVDAGNSLLAADELKRMNPGKDAALKEAMVVLAVQAGVPDAALRMGSGFRTAAGGLYDAALYPDSPWQPGKGFEVDRALVHAFIRQESKFDPEANNRSSGALGLMQLMPRTAEHVAQQAGQKIGTRDIRDPMINVDLGQRYLRTLLDESVVDGNLFKLAAAYNAGPGKLARWVREGHGGDDPLLFIESIPVAETRIFVERVMTNFWIYRLKYGQPITSLESVASGEWPYYAHLDIRRGRSFAEAQGAR